MFGEIEILDSLAKDKTKTVIVFTDSCKKEHYLVINKNKPDQKLIKIWFENELKQVKLEKCD